MQETISVIRTVQARKWSRPANDPGTANDPQIGPQMIPGPEMIIAADSSE